MLLKEEVEQSGQKRTIEEKRKIRKEIWFRQKTEGNRKETAYMTMNYNDLGPVFYAPG